MVCLPLRSFEFGVAGRERRGEGGGADGCRCRRANAVEGFRKGVVCVGVYFGTDGAGIVVGEAVGCAEGCEEGKVMGGGGC